MQSGQVGGSGPEHVAIAARRQGRSGDCPIFGVRPKVVLGLLTVRVITEGPSRPTEAHRRETELDRAGAPSPATVKEGQAVRHRGDGAGVSGLTSSANWVLMDAGPFCSICASTTYGLARKGPIKPCPHSSREAGPAISRVSSARIQVGGEGQGQAATTTLRQV